MKNIFDPQEHTRFTGYTLRMALGNTSVTRRELYELEHRMTLRMGGALLGCTSLILAILFCLLDGNIV